MLRTSALAFATLIIAWVVPATAGPAGLLDLGSSRVQVTPVQYGGGGGGGGRGGVVVDGPGSGTGTGRYTGPGSGTGMGRCRKVTTRVCRSGGGTGTGPRCRIVRELRC
jgi:hypothetical protein